MRGAGPYAQPVFHPVTLNVFPAEPMVTVRSHIPGSVATNKKVDLSWKTVIKAFKYAKKQSTVQVFIYSFYISCSHYYRLDIYGYIDTRQSL